MSIDSAKDAALGATKFGRSLFQEFKNFAFKGNVVDLSVGVIIGAAFGSIVKSFTEDVLTPLIGLITPNRKFEAWMLGPVKIGNFLNSLVSFLITAFAIYLFIVKFLGWVMKTKDTAPPEPTLQEKLLMEIRDELKGKRPV